MSDRHEIRTASILQTKLTQALWKNYDHVANGVFF